MKYLAEYLEHLSAQEMTANIIVSVNGVDWGGVLSLAWVLGNVF